MREIWNFIKEHLGLFIGGAIGFTVGVMMLTIGFWGTLLLTITTALGALLVGKSSFRSTAYAWLKGVYYKLFKKQ